MSVAARMMAEQSPDEQRKLASIDEEVLEHDHDVEIDEADMQEAENSSMKSQWQ